MFHGEASRAAPKTRLANWTPLRRAWTTITSVALGAVQFSPEAETCREVLTAAAALSPRCVRRRYARGRRAIRPEISSHVGERSRAPPGSIGEGERSAWRDIRSRARLHVPPSPPDVAFAARSPSRPLSRAFPRHPDPDSPASPDSVPSSRQFMRVGAVVVGLGYGAVMGTFTGLVRSRVAPFARLPPRAPSARRHREIVRRESSPQGSK